ncbi:uncharacterized protein MKK02DRAFT_44113 [Dioszegia hungarica]|uniref:Uncharacterized protein n=1 Tax=Dioszegia hungarica TaxID=4972 RepID=A0AA38HAE9_9TREE|nr:uncharacterized protein MKK02DRAFT_44113 [Dioszegia hungarica]KAI9635424.1 hypothetical protein MKK02DRAFT_44113 [Dioszegia hungarica]
MDISPLPTESSMLTPFHLIVLAFASLSLLVSQLNLPPDLEELASIWRRVTSLLVVVLLMYHVVENESSHPSAFLTTKDAKPRLWAFPLGKAGGEGTKEMWWEAGNAAHVGHFKQSETPEAREELRLKMEAKEEARAKAAKKALEEFEENRKKWYNRLAKVKVIGAIVAIGLVHKTLAAICLAGLIYWLIATRLADMMKPPDEPEPEISAARRRKVPTGPGMAMTYLFEPTANGGVVEAGTIPVQAPSHRLMTSMDNRYAS